MKQYKEPKGLNDVAEFHDTFNLPIVEEPSIPAKERCDLRISLLQEELNELKDAVANNDLIEVADALADIQYVLSGAILEFGLAEKFEGLFSEVHRSNMSKVCQNHAEALETQQHYRETKQTESYLKEKGDGYIVYRVGDSKVLKSIEYSPANIKKFV